MLPDGIHRELAKNGFRITQVRVQDGNGNGWMTIDIMEWIGLPADEVPPSHEPATGPPIVEGG